MATRRLENHDVDLNGHRHIVRRGVDVAVSDSGDLALTSGNYFRVSPGSSGELRRISTAGWLSGGLIAIEAAGSLQIVNGVASGGGYASIATPGEVTVSLQAGDVVAVSYNGTAWKPHKIGGPSDVTYAGGPQYITDVNWNLRDAADQTVYDDGSLVLGGYTGTVVNFGRSQAFEVQNGSGLYIRANTNASNNYMGDLTAPTAYWALPRFYPNFLHSRWREVWVLFMARPITPPVVQYNGFDVGIAVMTDIWGFNTINRAAITGQFVDPSYRGGGIGVTLAGTTTRIVGQAEDPDAHDVFAFRLLGHTEVQMFRGESVGGDFPALSALEPLGWGLMQDGGVFLRQENTVIYVSAYGANNTGNADVLLERVKVMHLDPTTTGTIPIPVDSRPSRSEATIVSNVVTVPGRARAGTVIVSGAMTLDGVDITGSGFVDGDEFELILSGTGSVVLTHNAAGLAAGVVPFYVPPPTGGDAQDLELTLSGSTPLRNVVLRYLENEGFALVSGGMLS